MLVKYIKDAAGIAAGTVKNLPASLAAAMIAKGVCVEAEGEDAINAIADTVQAKEGDFLQDPEYIKEKENAIAEARETKEDKKASKRQTK